MAIDAPDGVKTVKVAGLELSLEGGEKTIKTSGGTLTVSYKADSIHKGELSYSYTLSDNLEVFGDKASNDLSIEVGDYNGSAGKSTLRVNIVDDAPEARADEGSISRDAETPITGNVLDNDTQGADGLKGDVVWEEKVSQYGALVKNTDGSWSFAVDRENEAVAGLQAGESLKETFTDPYFYT